MNIKPNSIHLANDDGLWLFSGSAEANKEGERIFACGAGTVATAAGFNTEAVAIHPEAIVSATHPDARVIRATYAATL
jgi:hypothetical protein